jgi:hypothetical protein
MKLRDTVIEAARSVLQKDELLRIRFPDVDKGVLDIFSKVKRYTMTSPERVIALCAAVKYIADHDIVGDIVECGVWRGGSSMAAALMLLGLDRADRRLYLFDTFQGMSPPTQHDRRARDLTDAEKLLNSASREDKIWCYSPLEEVRRNLASTGYPGERLAFVEGRVEETIPARAPERIALLRLDTDWYESTRHELEHLFPRLSVGGVLIVDDYGAWEGARRAVDEYIEKTGARLMLNRIDETGRIAIKLQDEG